MTTYTLVGNPIPLKRPRFAFKTKHVYDSQLNEKNEARLQLSLQHKRQPLYEGAIWLDVVFFMQIPTSYSKKKKESLVGEPHVGTPDLSNLVKWLEDCCAKILFDDDKTINEITAKKIYGEVARTEFIIDRQLPPASVPLGI